MLNVCGDIITAQCVVVPESDGRGAEEKADSWQMEQSFDLSIVCSFKRIEH